MRTRLSLLGATITALSLSATAASAGIYDPTSESINTPKMSPFKDKLTEALYLHNNIVVTSEDHEYVKALPGKLAIGFHVDVSTTKNKWRIKESYITTGMAPIKSGGVTGTCCGSLSEFSETDHAYAVDVDSNTEHLQKDAWWAADVDDENFGTRARNACRKLHKELQQQGMKNDDIFGQDRFTTMSTEFRFVARAGHKNPNHDVHEDGAVRTYWKQSQPYWTNIGVTCQRDMTSDVVGDPNPDPTPLPTGSGDIAIGFQVNQAALAITPNDYEAKCPAKLHLNPTIEATGKGTVKYRFVDQLGNKSQVFQVKFTKSDVKFLDHVIEIDGKGKPTGLGFKAPQKQGGGFGLVGNTPANVKQGYFQLEVIAPHKKLSNMADYSVKCTVKTAGNDTLAPKPDVIKPGVLVGDLTLGTADLVVEAVDYLPEAPTQVRVKVANKGTQASAATSLKTLRWVGNQAHTMHTPVGALKADEAVVFMAETGGPVEDATHLYVRVDDPSLVKELNEGNNSAKLK